MRLILFLAAASLATAQTSPPGTYLCAPFGPAGTWNLYQTSSDPLPWAEAVALAASKKDPKGATDKMGHLVTIGSAAENMFVYQFVEGWHLWIGLTDNEKHGREAGSNRGSGWAWITGEPFGDFTPPWCGAEPNAATAGGEDAVAMEYGSRWADWPSGAGAENTVAYPFLIEWDTALPQPIEGVRTIGRVLPEKWPVDLLEGKAARSGSGPWTIAAISEINGHNLRAAVADFTAAMKPDMPRFAMQRLNYRSASTTPAAGGWIQVLEEPAHPLSEKGSGALHVATVRVEQPGPWSINIHSDDFFAARFPGHRWKRVHGLAGTDPLDPETMFYDCENGDGNGIGIIELSAGEHRFELFLGNRIRGALMQLLAAPGEFTTDGATDRWRLPGHQAGDTTLAWPGVTDAGWSVTRALPDASLRTLRSAFNQLQNEDVFKGVAFDRIHFIEPAAPGDVLFPGPVPFPADAPGDQNNFAVFATATLVIPREGVYHFGVHSEDHSALCIGGQKLLTHIRSTGGAGRIDGDTVWEETPTRTGHNSQNVAAVSLTAGEHPVEVLYAETIGPSVLSVFAGPAACPPRLLVKGGAKIEADVDGLPLVEVK